MAAACVLNGRPDTSLLAGIISLLPWLLLRARLDALGGRLAERPPLARTGRFESKDIRQYAEDTLVEYVPLSGCLYHSRTVPTLNPKTRA